MRARLEEGLKGAEERAFRAARWARPVAGVKWQGEALRDLFGNPFRPVSVPPACLAWDEAVLPKLAAAISAERAFDRLPILGDALEEAGCGDPSLLDRCRGPGPHFRGCWAVDAILGRE